MRAFFTLILAFFVSLFASGAAVVKIAETTRAREEFILVFMALGLLLILCAILFGVAQTRREPARAINTVGKFLLAFLLAIMLALIGMSAVSARNVADLVRDIPIIAGIGLPGVVAVAAQWLIVRWRVREA